MLIHGIPVFREKDAGIIYIQNNKSSLWMQNLSDTIRVSAYTVCLMVPSMFMIASKEKIRIEIAPGVFLLRNPEDLTLSRSEIIEKIEQTIIWLDPLISLISKQICSPLSNT
jgi:hypothetical protein